MEVKEVHDTLHHKFSSEKLRTNLLEWFKWIEFFIGALAIWVNKVLKWNNFYTWNSISKRLFGSKYIRIYQIKYGYYLAVQPRPPSSIQLHPAPPMSTHVHPAHFSFHPALWNTLNNIWTKILHVIGQFPQIYAKKSKVV